MEQFVNIICHGTIFPQWEKNFQINLIRHRSYGFGNQQFYNGLLKEQLEKLQNIEYKLSFEEAKNIFETKNYKDAAMRGRTSFKPLEKMGIAFIVDKKLQISKLKEYILWYNSFRR